MSTLIPTSRVPRSMEMYQRALELIPGGTQLISRRPSRVAYGVSPIYAARAKGARFWDIDGHEYIDWVSGIAAIILGYADDVVDNAVIEQISHGNCFAINHELEVELAEELVNLIPCAEMVRYAKCGGEACSIAVRIARGATGRDRILFCGYHGWHDWYLAANLDSSGALNQHLFSGIEPIGVPQALSETSVPFPYGDADALGELLDEYKGTVAAIIMEPCRTEHPPQGYLQAVRKLANEHDVVLIFDEVSTGFRHGVDGVQTVLGVVPDLAVFAKSISNGYPMGCVVGKRDVMEAASRMFISSTYWSDTIGMRAALTTLREIRRRNVPQQLHQFGARLQQEINKVAAATGAPVECYGVEVHPSLRFSPTDPADMQKMSTLYVQEMAKRGCHGYPSFYLNAAQGEAELQQTLAAAEEVFTILRETTESGDWDAKLECELRTDAFQRLVK